MRTRGSLILAIVGAAFLSAATFLWFTGPRFSLTTKDAPHPGSVLAQSTAPNGTLVARVLSENVAGSYAFELRANPSGDLVAVREISAPVGYHPQIVTLEWDLVRDAPWR